MSGMYIIFLIAGVILAMMVLPAVLMMASPVLEIIIKVALAIIIFSNIRAHFGNNILTIIISAVLIYLLVIKWASFTAAVYIFMFLIVPTQFASLAIWTIGTIFGRE